MKNKKALIAIVAVLFVVVGAITHIVLNMLLFFLHIRKNMF